MRRIRAVSEAVSTSYTIRYGHTATSSRVPTAKPTRPRLGDCRRRRAVLVRCVWLRADFPPRHGGQFGRRRYELPPTIERSRMAQGRRWGVKFTLAKAQEPSTHVLVGHIARISPSFGYSCLKEPAFSLNIRIDLGGSLVHSAGSGRSWTTSAR